jgi:hypothetical protein
MPCKAPAVEGGFCFFHADPTRPSRLGRTGGRKNRHSHIDLQISDHVDATALRDLELQVLRAITAGEINHRTAAVFFAGCNSLQRLLPPIDTAELSHKIAQLEQRLADYEMQATTAPSSNAADSELDRVGEEDANTHEGAQNKEEDTPTVAQSTSPQNGAPTCGAATQQETDSPGYSEGTQLDSDRSEHAYDEQEDDKEREK